MYFKGNKYFLYACRVLEKISIVLRHIKGTTIVLTPCV